MESGARRTIAVLHVGSEEELVREAVSGASADCRVTSVEEPDAAKTALDAEAFDAVIVETDTEGDWSDLLAVVDELPGSVPAIVLTEDESRRTEAIDAGGTDVVVCRGDDVTVLERRLRNVVPDAASGIDSDPLTGEPAIGEGRKLSRVLLDTIEDVVYLADPQGNLLRWNDSLTAVTGYTDDEIAAMGPLPLFPDDERAAVVESIGEGIEIGDLRGDASFETEIETRDGERIPFDFSATPLVGDDGDLRGIVGVGRDVSARKERQRELELAETVFEEAQDSMFVVDVEDGAFRIERVNPAYEASTGLDAATIEGKRPDELFEDAEANAVLERYRTCVEEGTPIEYEERLEIASEQRDWHTKLAPVHEDGTVTKLVGATRDVTEHKELERELKEQANLLDHIFNQVPSALYVKDEDARFVRKRNYDEDPQDFVGKTDVEFFGDIEYARQTYADDLRVIEEGERIINKEEYNPLNDDWVLTSKVPWRDEAGDIQGLIGVSRLITEKKAFERELALRYRAMEEAPIGICIFDLEDGRRSIRYANAGFEQLTGYARSAIEGGDLELLTGPETEETAMATLESAFDDGEAAAVVSILYRNDRSPLWGRISIAPVTDDDGNATHFVGFLQDVTEEKEHEQTIERRLDEFGDVLAQQLHPPLDVARDELQANGTADEAVERAMRSIDRADQLVEDLAAVNTFSVKSRDVSESFDTGTDR